MDRQMDEQTDRFPRVLQDFVPFGAAALLPFDFNKYKLVDHIFPVGDWLGFDSGLQALTLAHGP